MHQTEYLRLVEAASEWGVMNSAWDDAAGQIDPQVLGQVQRVVARLESTYRLLGEQQGSLEMLISQYTALDKTITTIRDSGAYSNVKTMVNVGEELFMQAVIPDARMICVDVGMGFYAELTHDEGIKFIAEKKALLEEKRALISSKMERLEEHLRVARMTMQQQQMQVQMQQEQQQQQQQ